MRHIAKFSGQWCYRYRAIDKHDEAADFLLIARREFDPAKRFFRFATCCAAQGLWFAEASAVVEQNRILEFCFGSPDVNEAENLQTYRAILK